MSKAQPAGKDQRQQAILALVSRGSAHTQQDIAAALSRRGHRVTQATISRDIHELGLVRSGAGFVGLFVVANDDNSANRTDVYARPLK